MRSREDRRKKDEWVGGGILSIVILRSCIQSSRV